VIDYPLDQVSRAGQTANGDVAYSLRALHVDAASTPVFTGSCPREAPRTPETVNHHLKPIRQRSVGPRQRDQHLLGSAWCATRWPHL